MSHILVVDDEKNFLTVLCALLEDEGYRVSTADNAFAALELIQRESVSLILSDLKMPRMNGLELLHQVRQETGDIPFIILTAFATVETALKAMKAGAFDYLLKPFKNDEVLLTVNKALAFARLRSENMAFRHQIEAGNDKEIIGKSAVIRQLRKEIALIAPARSSVLISGETGVGKELVARAIHHLSPRSDHPLVTINCAVFSENLLESELFGHERGAFTGAGERKQGLMEIADGGTLFLDEISELPLTLQPKLLRALQERRFRRLGGTAEIESDIRVVAASNRPLEGLISEGLFREDLYYRLNVVSLQVPPLRDRREDIPLLAFLFLNRFANELGRPTHNLSREAIRALQDYDWPGNVRELQNSLERGVLFSEGDTLQVTDLPEPLRSVSTQGPLLPELELGRPLPKLLEEVEEDLIRRALTQARGIQAQAAELLGISRSNLQYKLKKFGIV